MAFTLFGLTGGIACGKSTISGFFLSRGLPVLDADSFARQVVETGSEGLAELVAAYGDHILRDDASLDRKKLASTVFNDAEARKRLESIIHPRIREKCAQRAIELASAGHPLAAYEAALLVENDLVDAFRPLVVVVTDSAIQVERLMRRDGLTDEAARSRLAAQMPVEDKIKVADYVIDTSGSIERVRRRADCVLEALCSSLGVDVSRYPKRDGIGG